MASASVGKELEEYIKDMFLMVWRDATVGLGAEKHVVCNSATSLVMNKVEALKQELKQSLEAQIFEGWFEGEMKPSELHEIIETVFQDKGDNDGKS